MTTPTKSLLIPQPQLLLLAEQLLYGVKTETATDDIERALSDISLAALIAGLCDDNAKKTFWINIYNAWFQILAIRLSKTQPQIFTEKLIRIAGIQFSLDDIEHGILRKYRWKYSLGYLPQFNPAPHITQLCVATIDYRIHFALNCGAKSCPPIAFYQYEQLETQLTMATNAFLNAETTIDAANKIVKVNRIMLWFNGDFGGNGCITQILTTYCAHDVRAYRIVFQSYDWSTLLKNYVAE